MARPPKTFHEFIGQTRMVKHLQRLIAGAKALGRACPSLLLTAPSGCGKTALAGAVAAAYGSTFHPLLAGEDTRTAEICEMLLAGQHGDVFFIDEAHSLRQDPQQVLYIALDQQKAPALHEGRVQRTQFDSVACCTLILATNQPGRLQRGLRNRLTPLEFDPYTVPELKSIAERVARQDGMALTPHAARVLAEMAQGAPRHVARRIEALQLLWPSIQTFGQEHVRALLHSEGVDAHGFWPRQRLYLLTLGASPGGVCSLERLSAKLGCDVVHLRQDIEPHLIDQGLVDVRSGRGRTLTAAGRALLTDLMAWTTDKDALETPRQEECSC